MWLVATVFLGYSVLPFHLTGKQFLIKPEREELIQRNKVRLDLKWGSGDCSQARLLTLPQFLKQYFGVRGAELESWFPWDVEPWGHKFTLSHSLSSDLVALLHFLWFNHHFLTHRLRGMLNCILYGPPVCAVRQTDPYWVLCWECSVEEQQWLLKSPGSSDLVRRLEATYSLLVPEHCQGD